MSTTLNLVDCLFARGRNYQELGRTRDALHTFGCLAGFRELPPELAEETQVRLAELQLRRRKYQRARRHLTAALRHQPDNAHNHYLMGTAVDADSKGDPERAAEHYRRSLELDPDQPQCLGEYGLLAVRQGQTEEGLGCLCHAVELAPNDPAAVQRLVKGLRLANRPDEARAALLAALFRNPRDGRFRRLWDDFRFDQLRREQETARLDRAVEAGEQEGPVLLPFVRPTTPVEPGHKRIRRDGASGTPGPHAPQPTWLPGQRHVQ